MPRSMGQKTELMKGSPEVIFNLISELVIVCAASNIPISCQESKGLSRISNYLRHFKGLCYLRDQIIPIVCLALHCASKRGHAKAQKY